MSITAPAPTYDQLMWMYTVQATAQACDQRLRSLLADGQLSAGSSWPWGRECVAAGYAVHLHPDDQVVTTGRGLHDHIAKGVPLPELWAELLGRATGICKGKGGPMHITHPPSGLVATTAMAGTGLLIATGLALANQLDGSDRVTVASCSDGATTTGIVVGEALNLAAVWRLPVVFVCQTTGGDGAVRAMPDGMPGVTVNGDEPLAMFATAGEAVARARAGEGPTLIDARTDRVTDSTASADDPVTRYRAWLFEHGGATAGELAHIDQRVAAEVDAAVAFAMASPEPDLAELMTDVFAVR